MNKVVILMLIVLSGCALSHYGQGNKAAIPDKIMKNATQIFSTPNFIYTETKTHGVIPDLIGVSVHNGKSATNLREALSVISKSPNAIKRIVIAGQNPLLTRSELEGALSTDEKFPGIWLAYAGDKRNSDILKPLAESRGIKYSFINICSNDSVNVLCSLD